jgi:hypothetical protein
VTPNGGEQFFTCDANYENTQKVNYQLVTDFWLKCENGDWIFRDTISSGVKFTANTCKPKSSTPTCKVLGDHVYGEYGWTPKGAHFEVKSGVDMTVKCGEHAKNPKGDTNQKPFILRCNPNTGLLQYQIPLPTNLNFTDVPVSQKSGDEYKICTLYYNNTIIV